MTGLTRARQLTGSFLTVIPAAFLQPFEVDKERHRKRLCIPQEPCY